MPKDRSPREDIVREAQAQVQESLEQLERRIVNRTVHGRDHHTRAGVPEVDPEEIEVYREALIALQAVGLPFAVGGGFAKFFYIESWRYTKDLDIFVKPEHLRTAMDTLERMGFRTKVSDRGWLAKAFKGEVMIDLIFGSGHGLLPVDDRFFEGSPMAEIFGIQVPLVPVEEVLALNLYVATHDRFDGNAIVHLFLATKGQIDWQRILDRLGEDWELLLWYLILFDWIYPGHPDYLPQELMSELFDRARERWKHPADEKTSRGTLIDPVSFAVDVDGWGYEDRRNEEPLVNERGELL
jgi:hypothetical protein